jgi:NDP-sugar pyrophosphorylase family protein
VMAPESLDIVRPGEHSDMPTLFGRLQARGARTIAYPMHEPWLDIGEPKDYSRANTERDPHDQ